MLIQKVPAAYLLGGALCAFAAMPYAALQANEPPHGATIVRPPHSGSFVGIGAALDPKLSADGYVVVRIITPQAGAAAKKALRPGDKIARVNGKPVRNATISRVVGMLREGKENTPVRLTLLRAGAKKPLEVTVKRRMIYAVGEGPVEK